MPNRHHLLAPLLLVATLFVAACSPAASPAPAPAQEARSNTARPEPPARPGAADGAPQLSAAAPAAKPAARAGAAQQAESAAPAAAPPSQPGADSPASLPNVVSASRMIVYTTEVTLLLTDLDGFPDRATQITSALGGYLAGTESSRDNGVQTVVVKLKVPAPRYDEAMRALRGLAADVRDEKATTQDVTEEYSDAQTQIASLEAAYAQVLELQKRANTIEEITRIQQQAQQLKLQIDRLKGRATVLERLSDFATITARGQAVAPVLQRDFMAERAALRKAEAQRANLEAQLLRVRTPEEEAALRDKLGETALEISRREDRIATLTRLALGAGVELPPADLAAGAGAVGLNALPEQYVTTRVALRRAEYQRATLTAGLQARRPDVTTDDLTRAVLDVNRLSQQLSTIQERARQANLTLPTLDREQEATLAGVPAGPTLLTQDLMDTARRGWEFSLTVLATILTLLVGGLAFGWWLIPLGAGVVAFIRWQRGHSGRPRLAPVAPTAKA